MSQPEPRKRAVSDILETGAGLAARHILVFLRVTAPLTLPVGVLFGAVAVWLANSSGTRHVAIGVFVAVAVVYALAVTLAGAACFKLAAEVYDDAGASARAAIEHVLRRPASVLGLATLLLIGGAPAVALLVLPGITAPGNYTLILLILLVFSLRLSGVFSVAFPAMLVEERGVMDSLRRSALLVRGSFWRALGTVILGGILALFVLVAILVSIFSLGGGNVILIVTLTGAVLGELLVAPLFAAFLTVLYYDLRAREHEPIVGQAS